MLSFSQPACVSSSYVWAERSMINASVTSGGAAALVHARHGTQELGHVPYPLLWLRYSAFLVLYPFGVGSEMTMARLAMPVIRDRGLLTLRMPNALNYSFDYYWFCWLAVACYLPGLPQLYLYMLKQRKRVLGPQQAQGRIAAAAPGRGALDDEPAPCLVYAGAQRQCRGQRIVSDGVLVRRLRRWRQAPALWGGSFWPVSKVLRGREYMACAGLPPATSRLP